MNATYKHTVDSGDLIGTRLSLANEMMLDPRGGSFREMQAYAEAALPDLYEPHDGSPLDTDQSHWNEDLLYSTRSDLNSNFSRERIDLYYKIAQVVLADKARNLETQAQKKSRREIQTAKYPNGNQGKGKNPLLIGLAVGGLLLGGTGLIMGRAAVATIGLIGATIGGAILYNDSKK